MMGNRSDCKTPGAFGKQADQNAPRRTRKQLMVRKFQPPPEVQHRIKQKDAERPHPNRFIRWIKKFFGEGF